MLDMIEITAKKGLERLEAITSLNGKNDKRNQKPNYLKAYSRELIEILFRLPYTKRQHLIDEKLGTPKTVGNYLRDLEGAGFLKSVKVGKEKLYLNFQLMEILEK